MALRDDGKLPNNAFHTFYSLGVIDYFSDKLVVKLLDFIHSKLVLGGTAFLGNFRPGHPNAALFEFSLDWPLTLRSVQELRNLVRHSKFGECPTVVGVESEGVQLFIECTKVF